MDVLSQPIHENQIQVLRESASQSDSEITIRGSAPERLAPQSFAVAIDQLSEVVHNLAADIDTSKAIRTALSDKTATEEKVQSIKALENLINDHSGNTTLVAKRGIDALHIALHCSEPEAQAAAEDSLRELLPAQLTDLKESQRDSLEALHAAQTPLVPLSHYGEQLEQWAADAAPATTGGIKEVQQLVDTLHQLWKLPQDMDYQLSEKLAAVIYQEKFQSGLRDLLEKGEPFSQWVRTPGNEESDTLRQLKIAASLLDTRTESTGGESTPLNEESYNYAYKSQPLIPFDYVDITKRIASLVTGKDPDNFWSISSPTSSTLWKGLLDPTPDMTNYCVECEETGQRVQVAYSFDRHRMTPLLDQNRKLNEEHEHNLSESNQQTSVYRVRIVDHDRHFHKGGEPVRESFVSPEKLRELMQPHGPHFVSPPNEAGNANAEHVIRTTRMNVPDWIARDIPDAPG